MQLEVTRRHRHTGLLRLAELLRESLYGSVAITVLFAVAAVCNWQSGSAWLAQRAADRVRDAAVVAVYLLAGVPAAVDLTYDLASLHVDTHVLMTLAVIGTLLIGGALEVISALGRTLFPCLTEMLERLGLVVDWTHNRIAAATASEDVALSAAALCRARCCWYCSRCRTRWSTCSRHGPLATCAPCSR